MTAIDSPGVPLSFIALTGEALDGPAILVASVALGVCVDDTIHFFAKFTKARRAGNDLRASLVFTYDQVGRARSLDQHLYELFIGLVLRHIAGQHAAHLHDQRADVLRTQLQPRGQPLVQCRELSIVQ